ncbi:DUF1853 family protein [Thalassolituus sp. LLYu03]|uniref:DUF1853 family protein n=1 Tax=Thalassolituus sp. LLYu03 TaxID=3421656 RepID=UPI003D2B169A
MLPSSPAPDHAYFRLLQQHQRDRTWSLLGPALLDTDWSPAAAPFLSHLNNDDLWATITGLPAPDYRSSRLGLMFETLWAQTLNALFPRVEANRQILEGQATRGELDLLLDDGRQHWHAELALKFYLAANGDWIGPNSRDHLPRKIRHTREHQLPLSQQTAVQEQLAAAGWYPAQSVSVMKGCLFYRADEKAHAPEGVNPDHWQGRWCFAREMAGTLPAGDWSLISKDQWLSPAVLPNRVTKEELVRYLTRHFASLSYPACAVRLSEGTLGWCEQQRWLIMPDHWPEAGTHSRLAARPV